MQNIINVLFLFNANLGTVPKRPVIKYLLGRAQEKLESRFYQEGLVN